MRVWFGVPLAAASLLAAASPVSACIGDCNDDRTVTITELVVAVGIALDGANVDRCPAVDADGSGQVRIDELVAAVGAALDDCGGACAEQPAFPGAALTTELVTDAVDRPVHIAAPPGDAERIFIVEQRGRMLIVKDGGLVVEPAFLAIADRVSCCGERGLLSVAFHPQYASNGRFFVNYTDVGGDTVVARYQVSDDPDRADRASERVLLTIDQPFPNHNGGQLAFGPDGFLYVGMGDGGSGGDPADAGQDDGTLLGKLLRLDVDVDAPPYYAIPPTNPVAEFGVPLGLTWAKGLRNPWRFSFDRASGDLYIGDVGQGQFEEIDVQRAGSAGGENYGWDFFEADACFEPDPNPTCPAPDGFTFPVLSYGRDDGCSVTGGFVYRGCALPDLRGEYFYSDYCTGFLRTFRFDGTAATQRRDRTDELRPAAGGAISSFGEDALGELYIADLDGAVYKIVPRMP